MTNTKNLLSRAWYEGSIAEFIASPSENVLGVLASNSEMEIGVTQRNAWVEQIKILRSALQGLEGRVCFEFSIPRMGRRVDVVLITKSLIILLEFKVGEREYNRCSFEQVWDYALDLKNFHEGSHSKTIIPILIATEAEGAFGEVTKGSDGVCRPLRTNARSLRETIDICVKHADGADFDFNNWVCSPYQPTPTIIEAARALYAKHSVEAITRYDAGARNLHETSKRVEDVIKEARERNEKVICFITGVPGAGKTLVGLNIATNHSESSSLPHAVFLSGNGPLVSVLREALTRDEYSRLKSQGEKPRKANIATPIKSFIQNVHHFRDEFFKSEAPPHEHVVIFDEAQRAWNQQMTASFMKRKKKLDGVNQSEPEILISYMDRHPDWCVIVCLVGGGQEINTGEAGISEWLQAIPKKFIHWKVVVSPRLSDSEYAVGRVLEPISKNDQILFDSAFHLKVSLRSFRAESLSAFVKALLDCDYVGARSAFEKLDGRYPIVITRDLNLAKKWIRRRARGSERYGLMASSKAMRLKPYAVDIRAAVDPVHYFLNDRDDVRSSCYLEDAATEFQVQGLELDWACITWDADFRFNRNGWTHHDFRGCRWQNIQKEESKLYLKNAYRVLLTRARQGMVLFVPSGDVSDPTRDPSFYQPTFSYLESIGIKPISAVDKVN